MALVDVVIPTYKRPHLTQEAAKSVLEQTCAELKLYIVEDGDFSFSQDPASRPILDDPRVVVVRLSTQKGVAFCRNFGASLGNSPYLAFLDSDDLWLPRKLELQLEYFDKHSDIHYQHCEELWLKNNAQIFPKKRHKKQGGFFLQRAFVLCLISPSAVIFRRPFWEKYGWFCSSFPVAEDYELWLRLNLYFPVGFIPEPLVIKRSGPWPQLSSRIEIDRYRVLALHRLLRLEGKKAALAPHLDSLIQEALRKCDILIKGAQKHNKPQRLAQYQSWRRVFLRWRTRRESIFEEGIRKNSSA
ncbi:MAG: glycosyltransferase family 2 protein [Leptospiraceae bacterium]|nr:glycosyltransferase family 2 protein [Leptospiraceae bacterium]MDW8307559.1 glycosyltransferase family A protein [Leptospiraceae bacterium]